MITNLLSQRNFTSGRHFLNSDFLKFFDYRIEMYNLGRKCTTWAGFANYYPICPFKTPLTLLQTFSRSVVALQYGTRAFYTHLPTQYSYQNRSKKSRLKQRINQRQRPRSRQSPNSNLSNNISDSISQIQLPMFDYLQKTNYHENSDLSLHEIGHCLNVQPSFHQQNSNNPMFNNNYQSLHEYKLPPDVYVDMLTFGHNQINMPLNIVDHNMMENNINPTMATTTTSDYDHIHNFINTVPLNVNTSFLSSPSDLLYPPNNYVFIDEPTTDLSQVISSDSQQIHFNKVASINNDFQMFNYDSSYENIHLI
ncbi:7266_t:CDS:2 [Scutellospora calospora]|uniref:7266_t:CDS:1 n=1 Tax=Scutellospora calospora TaxID=85575 RepID=A0ACA9K7T9_9GLOM|nr:7266_t:CDS:2 [Scutellospora calospora]